ncbi:hypothetical protein, partial [Shewanella algae]|uniref:hypothetical protein n=1 Tax=Shewanella algae TaxID=38313 RepID=UPI001CA453A8
CDIQTDGCNLHSGPILFPDDFQQLHRGPLRGRLKGDGSIPLSMEIRDGVTTTSQFNGQLTIHESRSKACCCAALVMSQERLCEKERSRTSCPSRHSSFLPIRTAGEGLLLSGKLNPSWLVTLGFKATMATSPTQCFPKEKTIREQNH